MNYPHCRMCRAYKSLLNEAINSLEYLYLIFFLHYILVIHFGIFVPSRANCKYPCFAMRPAAQPSVVCLIPLTKYVIPRNSSTFPYHFFDSLKAYYPRREYSSMTQLNMSPISPKTNCPRLQYVPFTRLNTFIQFLFKQTTLYSAARW